MNARLDRLKQFLGGGLGITTDHRLVGNVAPGQELGIHDVETGQFHAIATTQQNAGIELRTGVTTRKRAMRRIPAPPPPTWRLWDTITAVDGWESGTIFGILASGIYHDELYFILSAVNGVALVRYNPETLQTTFIASLGETYNSHCTNMVEWNGDLWFDGFGFWDGDAITWVEKTSAYITNMFVYNGVLFTVGVDGIIMKTSETSEETIVYTFEPTPGISSWTSCLEHDGQFTIGYQFGYYDEEEGRDIFTFYVIRSTTGTTWEIIHEEQIFIYPLALILCQDEMRLVAQETEVEESVVIYREHEEEWSVQTTITPLYTDVAAVYSPLAVKGTIWLYNMENGRIFALPKDGTEATLAYEGVSIPTGRSCYPGMCFFEKYCYLLANTEIHAYRPDSPPSEL